MGQRPPAVFLGEWVSAPAPAPAGAAAGAPLIASTDVEATSLPCALGCAVCLISP